MMTMMMMTLLTLYMTPSLRVADFEWGHFGTLSQYQLLVHLVFSPLRKNVAVFICKIMN